MRESDTRRAPVRPTAASPGRLAVVVGVIAAAVVVGYGQEPLYSSNQNTYFLHGLANAGVGSLDRDWLVGTADPFPVFSALVELTERAGGGWMFYAQHVVLVLVYAVAMLLVVAFGRPVTAGRLVIPGLGMIASHSLLLSDLSDRFVGRDLPSILTWGVADQYVLGAVLQPSAFGVFLIASVAAFLRRRLLLAAALAVVASTFHTTYLWPGGGDGTVLIPPGLDGFRLATERPVVVDGKTHPYGDLDVLAWDLRLRDVETMYGDIAACAVVEGTMRRYGATWLLVPADEPQPVCSTLRAAYADQTFALYRSGTG